MNITKQDDELDIFELFKTMWSGKWIIVVFMFISIAASFTFSSYKKKVCPHLTLWCLRHTQ